MTISHERTRAIISTEVFLRELSGDRRLPEDVRSHAKHLLRHYPSADQVISIGRFEACATGSVPDDEFRRRVIAIHEPLLSSSLEPL